jgi:hypothetical protein
LIGRKGTHIYLISVLPDMGAYKIKTPKPKLKFIFMLRFNDSWVAGKRYVRTKDYDLMGRDL